jgi:hypothetical protein
VTPFRCPASLAEYLKSKKYKGGSVKGIDFLFLLIIVAVFLVWLERQRTTTVIVLFPKDQPVTPLAAETRETTSTVPAKRVGFAYA